MQPQLKITTDPAQDRATVTVRCDAEFMEFEVNAMNLLEVRYSLHCELLDVDIFYEPAAVLFQGLEFPRAGRRETMHEHAEFVTEAAMHGPTLPVGR